MRFGVMSISLVVALAAPGCGYSTSPTPSAAFSLDAGNFTLKISGTGTCSVSGTGTHEGSVPVTVTRTGSTWSVRSLQAGDTFAMSFTTDGAPTGSAGGAVSGSLTGAAGLMITATGSIAATNSATNVAGGPITNPAGTLSAVVNFSEPAGGGSCFSGTWTLTPR